MFMQPLSSDTDPPSPEKEKAEKKKNEEKTKSPIKIKRWVTKRAQAGVERYNRFVVAQTLTRHASNVSILNVGVFFF